MIIDDFVIRALLAGLGVALAAGPLGCFVVWRRMAYFGDAMAHSALLGVALGIVLGISETIMVAGVGVLLAGFLSLLLRQRQVAQDTLLGIFSHWALSSGLILLALLGTAGVDLHAWLFGDILAVADTDIYWIWGGAGLAISVLAGLWRTLLAATVNAEMARVEGLPVRLAEIGLMLVLALTIAAAIKVVGVLLTTALLIMPAATARRLARTPESMAVIAGVVGMIAVFMGLGASLLWDTPAGPAVVFAASSLFALAMIGPLKAG